MYISTARNQVFAVDAATGKVIWNYKYTPHPNYVKAGSQGSFVQNRGVALGDGKVFMGTIDSHLVAIDQKTGREVLRPHDATTRTGDSGTVVRQTVGRKLVASRICHSFIQGC
jgi:glucose dehydrogenase